MSDPQYYRFAVCTQRRDGEHIVRHPYALALSGLPFPATEAKKEELVRELAATRTLSAANVHYIYLISTLPPGSPARYVVEEYKVTRETTLQPLGEMTL